MLSLAAALQEGAALLAPSPTASRDAELLLLHITRLGKAELLTHPEREITDRQRDHYHAALSRRAAQEPVQHITGQQEFYGRPFIVNRLVLIPRPETEHLIEAALALAPQPSGSSRPERSAVERSAAPPGVPHPDPEQREGEGWEGAPTPTQETPGAALSILDIGTGSGILAITLALELPSVTVTATDISPAALAIARQNAAQLGASERIRFVHSDLFAALGETQYDWIVSNPPYVGTTEQLAPEVRDYEPPTALYAGADGLDIYRRLIPAAFGHLSSAGCLMLEIGHGQRDVVAQLVEAAGFTGLGFVNDLQQIPRVAIAQKKKQGTLP